MSLHDAQLSGLELAQLIQDPRFLYGDFAAASTFVHESTCNLLDCHSLSVWKRSEMRPDEYLCVHRVEVSGQLPPLREPAPACLHLFGDIFDSGHPYVSGEYWTGIKQKLACICLPVRHRGRIESLLYLEHTDAAHAWRPEELVLANHLSLLSGLLLERREKERALESLRESRETCWQLLQELSDGIVVLSGGTTVFRNVAFDAIEIAAGLGALVPQIISLLQGNRTALQFMTQVAGGAHSAARDHRFVRPDGTDYYLRLWCTPFQWQEQSAIKLQVRDLDRAIKEQQRLRVLASQIQTLANSYPGGFTYVDANQVIRMVNSVSLQWLGIRAEQIIGREVRDFAGPDRYQELKPHIERALAGNTASFERTLVYPVAGKKDIHTLYVPDIADDGSVHGYFSLITDLTETHRTQRALHHAQKMEAVGQLSGGIAHDFNNLLTVIQGNVELLSSELAADSPLQRNLELAQRATQRGTELTRKLLRFSRNNPAGMEVVDINPLIEGMRSFLAKPLTASIHVQLELQDGLWPVCVNRGDLEDALLNLVLNARDAMAGSGTITIATCNRPGNDQDQVEISVADTGCGIEDSQRERIFEPFYTSKGQDEGTGLGLSMVYSFVLSSHGNIAVESELGEGTCFRLLLPRSDTAGADGSAAQPEQQLPQGSETLLVVDDDNDLLATVKYLFEKLGYRVLVANNAIAALKLLQRRERIDLLFCDLVLGGNMNGLQLLLHAREQLPGLRQLLTSGMERPDERLPPGIDILRKPYRLEDLARRVRAVLDGPAPRRG